MIPTVQANIVMLRMSTLRQRLQVSRSTIYSWMDPKSNYHDPSFPKPIKLGASAVAWVESEVAGWLEKRIRASRKSTL